MNNMMTDLKYAHCTNIKYCDNTYTFTIGTHNGMLVVRGQNRFKLYIDNINIYNNQTWRACCTYLLKVFKEA